MRIIAHRGSSSIYEENTMEAFEHALKVGSDAIELDVRLCATGEPVVFHDASLWRVDSTLRRISKTSLFQLKQQYPFIPTLEEVLDAFGKKTQMVLDLKTNGLARSKLELVVLHKIWERGLTDSIVLSSDVALSICKLFALQKKQHRYALVLEKSLLPNVFPHFLQLEALHINSNLANYSYIRKWKSNGMKVRVWTVNQKQAAIDLFNNGADAIITDCPGKMIDL